MSYSPTPCPTSFGTTHYLKTTSISVWNGPAQYVRHACNWVFGTPYFNVGDTGSDQDATWVVRPGVDGTDGSVSFESVGFQVRARVTHVRVCVYLCSFESIGLCR